VISITALSRRNCLLRPRCLTAVIATVIQMSFAQILILTAYSSGLVGGQLLFKIAAQRANFSSPAGFVRLLTDPVFLCAVPLYAMLMVVWVWVLTFTPLSKAYLFVALALAITPLTAALVFDEPFTLKLAIGIGLVLAGLSFVSL
jgi:drug/metabolite transporter (DMT)-like permease